MAINPDSDELEATIARMEARFDAEPRATDLMRGYRKLCERFAEDLPNPRDVALSRAAALMMIKYQLEG